MAKKKWESKAAFMRDMFRQHGNIGGPKMAELARKHKIGTVSSSEITACRKQVFHAEKRAPNKRPGRPGRGYEANGQLTGSKLLREVDKLSDRMGGIERLSNAVREHKELAARLENL